MAASPKTDVPGELDPCSVPLNWLLTVASSTAYHVDDASGCSGCLRSLLVRSGLHKLFALILLLLLFDLACPGGSFDNREFCRFGGAMKGSAPGTASSVRPTRAFGAWARTWWSVICAETVRMEEGDAVHVHPGEFRWMALTSRIGGWWLRGGMVSFCSWPVWRHDAISSSFMGDAPR